MKSKILKHIIICYFLSIILGSIFYSVIHKNYSLANVIFYVANVKIQFIFSLINLVFLFINKKNYYYLMNGLFFLPQLTVLIIFLMIDKNTKDSIITFYIPFFIVQTLLYFKIRKMFTDLNE